MSGCTIDALGKVFGQVGDRGSFEEGCQVLGHWLAEHSDPVDTGHWQALKDVPQTKTQELRSVVLVYGIPDKGSTLKKEVKPSDPWADDQFAERVAGQPVNPGETYTSWPWYRGNVETHKGDGKFSHTYMERYWPRKAGDEQGRILGLEKQHWGIRYRYGDLDDVVSLLAREPHTRQAYLPVWFPEDTGAHGGQRVPCSLGYHFMLRGGKLHVLYTIRSCDFLRHFRDDVYMTCRLVQWMLEQLRKKDMFWDSMVPGELTMVMHSLHVFEGDMPKMRREYGAPAAKPQG